LRKPRDPILVAKLLDGASGNLAPLLQRAARLHTLDTELRPLLDPALATHVMAMHVQEGELVIVTGSAAWATRLRFAAEELLRRLAKRDDLPLATSVRVIVRAVEAPPRQPPMSQPIPPGLDAAAGLLQSASVLPAGDPLRASLERLAARAGKRRSNS